VVVVDFSGDDGAHVGYSSRAYKVKGVNEMYELYDDCSTMFFSVIGTLWLT
jgi:hypothetical protein